MFNCAQMKERFSDYADGVMSAANTCAFERHIAHCSRCATDYKLFTATTAALEAIPEVETPKGLHSAIMRSIRTGAVPSKPKWWQVDWLNALSAKFPARPLATGLALTFVFGILYTLTPVGTATSSLLENKPQVQIVKAEQPNMALKDWGPWGGTTRQR